jgi:hypothetical protein
MDNLALPTLNVNLLLVSMVSAPVVTILSPAVTVMALLAPQATTLVLQRLVSRVYVLSVAPQTVTTAQVHPV